MRTPILLSLALLVGCGGAAAPSTPPATVEVPPPPKEDPAPAQAEANPAPAVTVQMIAATLGDDCGGAPPLGPPPAKGATQAKGAAKRDDAGPSKAKRRCDQTSIQLSIAAAASGKPATVRVEEVEIFDDAGASLGVVKASAPRKWSEDAYVDWDQQIAPGTELAVSYALSEPDWTKVPNRFDKTYIVKAKVSVDGAGRAVQTTVKVEARANPAVNVKT